MSTQRRPAGGAGAARAAVPAPLIEMRGISKAFGAIQALARVDLRLMPGEIFWASSATMPPANRR